MFSSQFNSSPQTVQVKMNSNYSEQLQSIYRNILLHQQSVAYANMMVAFTAAPAPTAAAESQPPAPEPIVKIEPGAPEVVVTSPPQSSPAASCSFSLDTEIPRDEIEGDIEVIMVRHFQDNLKKLDTTLNGLRGKKFGYRELLEISQTRPTYCPNSTVKRNRTLSVGSSGVGSSSIDDDQHPKKPKFDSTINSNADESFCSDDGRLMIDWNDPENNEAKEHPSQQPKVQIKKEKLETPAVKEDAGEYKPSRLRFERLKSIQKKKPRFNVDNLDLTYHSNMARNFPGTENRTEEQQERRNKNTLAARISRNKNKAYEKLLEQQSMDSTVENINLKRQVACLRVYANSLMKLSGYADTDFCKMWEANIKEMLLDTSE